MYVYICVYILCVYACVFVYVYTYIKDASLSWGAHLRMFPELRYNYQQVMLACMYVYWFVCVYIYIYTYIVCACVFVNVYARIKDASLSWGAHLRMFS